MLFQQPDLIVASRIVKSCLKPTISACRRKIRALRVERAQPKPFDGTADLLFDAVSHFARCLVCEGNGENLQGRYGLDGEMSEPSCENARLSGASTS